MRQIIEESDSEYEEDSYVALDDETYIPAANGDTGTPEDSHIEQEMIIEQEEEYDSDESVDDEPLPQNVSSIWIAIKQNGVTTHYPAHKQDLVTFCIKRVDPQQTVICLYQMSYSSQ